MPACLVRTARTSARRFRSTPVAVRRGGTISVGATSACTSTSSGRVPFHRTEDDRARGRAGLADEARGGVGDLDEAALAHLEDAHLAGCAEAVLEGAQRPEGPLALALEMEHAVDQVLERPGPRQGSLLGHVADQDQSHVEPLRRLQQRGGRLPDRADAPWCGVRDRQGLDRVDHAGGGSLRLEGGEHGLERGLGQHRHGQRRLPQPLCTPADLRRRLLARDIDDLVAGRPDVGKRHSGQRALPDPGGAAEQDQRAGHEAATEHPVELGDPGPEPRRALGLDVAQRHRLRPAGALGHAAPSRAARPRAHLLEAVPGPAARALPGPGERGVAALRAPVLGGFPGHPPRLGMRSDASRAVRSDTARRRTRMKRVGEWSTSAGHVSSLLLRAPPSTAASQAVLPAQARSCGQGQPTRGR